jgi:hypothetical protein
MWNCIGLNRPFLVDGSHLPYGLYAECASLSAQSRTNVRSLASRSLASTSSLLIPAKSHGGLLGHLIFYMLYYMAQGSVATETEMFLGLSVLAADLK